ncbi:MAG: hypothetical protein AB1499_08590 [Nitrospirota bacterium]
MKYSRWFLIVSAVIFILYLSIFGAGHTIKTDYSVNKRADGGYSLKIVMNKRYWKLVTPEGLFPSFKQIYTIELIGRGSDWSYRNQEGHYYSLNEINCFQKAWDFGYAWVSNDRKYIYLNLYWVMSPDNITPADVNGKYELQSKTM